MSNDTKQEIVMNMKGLNIISLVGVASLFGVSNAAMADCSFSGKIERVYQTATVSYVYMVPLTSLNSSYFQYFYTTDSDLMNAVHSAKDGNHYVNVYGTKSDGCTYNAGANWGGVISTVSRY
jgi:hypothetical protein